MFAYKTNSNKTICKPQKKQEEKIDIFEIPKIKYNVPNLGLQDRKSVV